MYTYIHTYKQTNIRTYKHAVPVVGASTAGQICPDPGGTSSSDRTGGGCGSGRTATSVVVHSGNTHI